MSQEEEPASPTARLMQAPGFNLCIFAVMGFMTPIDVDIFKKGMEENLLKHPRFSSLLVSNSPKPGKFTWKRTKVDVEKHVFVPDLDPNMESPDKFVEDFVSALSKVPVDSTKPLWEVHILNVKSSDANATAIFKIHHSVGDGVSLISLLVACSKKISDPEALPVIPAKKIKKKVVAKSGLVKRLFVLLWTVLVIVFNSFVDSTLFLATILFLKDTKTPIKGEKGVEVTPRRFVHRIVGLDDVKLVKRAMNVSVNDVILGVTEAGLSRYLNTRYENLGENGEEAFKKKTTLLPKNLRFRSGVVFNLRPAVKVEDLAEMMEKKDLKGHWGNIVSIVLLPLTIALQDDPLTYIRRAKATMDRKKLSLEPKLVFRTLKLLINVFGAKTAAAVTRAALCNTTITFSNVVGPQEEINLFGHPLCYVSPSVSGYPQAVVIHYQSYANKLVIALSADQDLVPNPHQLCDDLVKSLESIKDAVIKRGLVKDLQFS